jgi:PAS domain S-box-containing protein
MAATDQSGVPREADALTLTASTRLQSPGVRARGQAGVSDATLRSAFERSPSGMSVVGLDGRWLRINEAYSRMLGYRTAELIGRSFRDVTHAGEHAKDRRFTADALAGRRDTVQREKRYVRKDGSILSARTRVELIRDASGSPLYFVSHVEDLSEYRATLDLLHDSERMLRSVIDNTPAMICVKGRDHRYRLVNHEFADVFGVDTDSIVGLSDDAVLPQSMIAAERAKDRLVLDTGKATQEEQTITRDNQERVLLISRFPLRDENGIIDAVCTASTDITERRLTDRTRRERLRCSEMIHSALAQDRFVLHGQPVVNLKSMRPIATEVLVRIRPVNDGSELIEPGGFLPSAERFDLMLVIDEWVVDHAIELAAAGHRVSVNLSAQTVSNSTQVARIRAAVISSDASPQNLIFEITETAVAENLDAAHAFAIGIRELGCAIALDDFGVGHGTFTYLRHLPADYLKIDQQFVCGLLSNEEDHQVVEAIIGVAHQFNIETIAEGIEDQATLDELRKMGVDHSQGYWTGRPAPLPEAWTSVANRRRGGRDAGQG